MRTVLLKAGSVALLLLAQTTAAQAQRLARSLPAPAARTQNPVVVVPRQAGAGFRAETMSVANVASRSTVVAGGFSGVSVQSLLNPVPSFGFDFTHLAVVNRDLDVKALIDPITQGRLAIAERLLQETPQIPVLFPVFGQPAPIVLVQPSPPVVVVQQPPAVTIAPPQPAVQSVPVSPPGAESAPVEEVGEFTLVLRDGRRISAVAFTRQGNRIVYVTRDGSRRSFPLGELDAAETVRMNQERGTTLQLPL